MSDKCEKVITISQFQSTCWFNSILMVTLYSHRMRQLLLNKIKKMDDSKKDNPLIQVFIDVIESKYFEQENINPSELVSKLQLKPEEILHALNMINPLEFYLEIQDDVTYENVKFLSKGFFPEFYVNRFLSFFDIDYKKIILIDYYPEQKKFYISDSYINETLTDEYKQAYSSIPEQKNESDFKTEEEYQFFKNQYNLESKKFYTRISSQLDFLYKTLYENYKNGNFDILIIRYPEKETRNLLQNFKYELDYFKIQDTVQINNNTFILDSMFFTNYNIYTCEAGHSIAGITCNNKRYIYNGWTSHTNDPAMLSADNSLYSNIPCALIPYDWFNPNDKLSFCLNPKECKLDFFSLRKGKKKHKEDLCFNFNLGQNMHVFINKKSYNPTFIVSSELNTPTSPYSQLSINNNSKFIISSELNTPTSPDSQLSINNNPTFIVSSELNTPTSPDSQLSINNNSKFIVSSELNTPTSPDNNSNL